MLESLTTLAKRTKQSPKRMSKTMSEYQMYLHALFLLILENTPDLMSHLRHKRWSDIDLVS